MSKARAERVPERADQPDSQAVALVVRQPIYGPATTVIAYALLYQPAHGTATAHPGGPSAATLGMVADAALEIGLDRLAGTLPVHIKYPRALVVARSAPALLAERIVIEVSEELPGDPALIDGVRALRSLGHHIALDDYRPHLNSSALLEAVDMVKIDVSAVAPEALARVAPELIGRGLRLIAGNVETIEQFEHCAALGFEGFQGDFLQRPQSFGAQRVPTSRMATLRLIATLQDEHYPVDEVERLVSQDVSLSYRVLRCINSSYYHLPRKVDSIRQAIVILGLERLRQLCTLAALQGLDNRPPSLFVTAMARARMCEQLGRLGGDAQTGPYFITGLFSMLDVLTGLPITRLVEELPLAPQVVRALVAEEGTLGSTLKCARAYERAAWQQVAHANLAPELLRAAYVDAVFWAEEAQTTLSG
jgi:EAL and modified HD-GYP domain-containing signal transduction protein